MNTQELKARFYFACESFDNGQMTAQDAKQVVETVYGAMQETCNTLAAEYEADSTDTEKFLAQSNAGLDCFEVEQQARLRGLEL